MFNVIENDVIVIGGGIFGCLTSIELARKGFRVQLHERNSEIMAGASFNNQNRLHLGYHYPRDLETAAQCQKGFDTFKSKFSDCILEGFQNAYFISSFGSHVKFKEYKEFCDTAGLPAKEIDIGNFPLMLKNIEGGLSTDEVVYDATILKGLVVEHLHKSGVDVHINSKTEAVSHNESGFAVSTEAGSFNSRAVVNCTYANFNDFNDGMGLDSQPLQFELTVVPVINWRDGLEPIGVTVMDGKFFTVLPFGKSGKYLLYHVDHTVLETAVRPRYPAEWTDTMSYVGEDVAMQAFREMRTAASLWLPEISSSEFVDYLTTVRVVLADVEGSDRRPSLINRANLSHPFYTVFSGKIDHSIWVAEEISNKLSAELKMV